MKIVGDKGRFALGFELRPDPDRGGEPHVRASWGALQVWVDGRNITSGQAADGAALRSAEVPLAPVVRWLVECWDPLFHEERLPRRSRASSAAAWRMDALSVLPDDDAALDLLMEDREAWWRRHALGAALPEYRIPDLHLRRLAADVEVSWDDREWRSVSGGVHLMQVPGVARLPAQEAAEVCHGWAEAVVAALADEAAARGFVEEMRQALESIRRPAPGAALRRLRYAAGQGLEAAAAQLRRLAGVTSGGVEASLRSLLGLEAEPTGALITPLTLPALLYRSADPRLSVGDLTGLLALTRDLPPDTGALQPHRRAERPPDGMEAITRDGLDKALAFRAAVDIPSDSSLTGDWDLERALLPRLGVEVVDLRLDDTHVEGVAAYAPGAAPLIAVNKSGRFASTPWGRRMTIAHELCHLLHDFGGDGKVGVVSNPWAPYALERRANAFAAMLLLPPPVLGRVLPPDKDQWTPSALRHAMIELGVGRATLTWQLYNLGWITASEREAWLDAL